MFRLAKPGDVPRILDILAETHRQTRYADLAIDKPYARSLLAHAVQRNLGKHDGGCLVVVEEVDRRVEAFIVGTLSRVYMISDSLRAQDLFLVATKRASKAASLKLLDAYLKWASDNPKVYEVELSHTDVTEQSQRIGAIYERLGFEQFGRMYRRANPAFAGGIRELAA